MEKTKRKSVKKIVFIVLAVVLALLIALGGFAVYILKSGKPSPIHSTETGHFEDIAKYSAEEFFPENYNQYDDVSFETIREINLFPSICLKMKIHDEDDFEKLKAETERFQISKYDDRKFDYKSFRFTIAEYEEYPKYFGVIGISEETKTVYFLWHDNVELDSIDDFKEFVVINFKL